VSLVTAEVDVTVIRSWLGHESLDTTLQYYVKLERLRDLLHTTHPTVLAVRQECERLYQMAHKRYADITGA